MMAFPRNMTLEQLISSLPDNHQAKVEFEKLKQQVISLDDAVCEEIQNRDEWEERATRLAECVGVYFDSDVGEHSSANCPIANAHELLNQI